MARKGQRAYTKEELKKLLKDFYDNTGKFPTTRDMTSKNGLPTGRCYRQEFGDIKTAIIESGIPIPKDKLWLYDRVEYTKEEVIENFKTNLYEYMKENNGKLLTDDVIDHRDMVSASVIYKHFKTLDGMYEAVGINRKEYNKKLLEDDMIVKYNKMKNILGRPPHSRDIERFSNSSNEYYGCSTYLHHFGSMHSLHKLMGDTPTDWSREMTKDDMANALVRLKNDLGIVPVQYDLQYCEYTPSLNKYISVFGSYLDALYYAKLTPRSNKKILITKNGNKALSGFEYKFLLMLEKYNIEFNKEELYQTYIKDFEKKYRFDFTLNIDNCKYFIEIFGITGNEHYDKKIIEKVELCKSNSLNMIDLYGKDLLYLNIDDIYEMLIKRINNIKKEGVV